MRRRPLRFLHRWMLFVLVTLAAVGACGRDGTPVPSSSDATTAVPAALVEELAVVAASDLRPAFEELGRAFTAETGTKVVFTFGSSGQLREQVINGAPFDLFASANVEFVDEVIAAGRGLAATKADYALGRIVLWTPEGVVRPGRVADLAKARYRRLAIANPKHAPYGLAADQALRAAGIYDQVAGRLVFGENISDTFRIAKSGNADAAIVALSLVIADGSEYVLIPEDLHKPLQQALVVTGTGDKATAATAFAAFIGGPAGRAVMVRYGFVLPGEKVPGT